jgi:hypothetical protein
MDTRNNARKPIHQPTKDSKKEKVNASYQNTTTRDKLNMQTTLPSSICRLTKHQTILPFRIKGLVPRKPHMQFHPLVLALPKTNQTPPIPNDTRAERKVFTLHPGQSISNAMDSRNLSSLRMIILIPSSTRRPEIRLSMHFLFLSCLD